MPYHNFKISDWTGDDPLDIDLVGCGGNGCQMLTGLARMHVALRALGHPGLKVGVFDNDIVSEANVGRQLFSLSDVGRYKADVLVHRVNCYYGLEWESFARRWDSRGSTDILIGCVDSVAARRQLAKADYWYWLDLGNRDRTGQVILGQRPPEKKEPWDELRLQNFFDLYPELLSGRLKEDDAPSCSLAEALERQDLFINQAVSTFALNLLWRFIREGRTAIQGAFINLENGKATPMPVLKRAAPKTRTKPQAQAKPKRKRK
jgi:PRTRC genetic system ThiF family protein